jgi:hypothetical protein
VDSMVLLHFSKSGFNGFAPLFQKWVEWFCCHFSKSGLNSFAPLFQKWICLILCHNARCYIHSI